MKTWYSTDVLRTKSCSLQSLRIVFVYDLHSFYFAYRPICVVYGVIDVLVMLVSCMTLDINCVLRDNL